MAEFIFKKIAKDNGKTDDFLVCSAATSTENVYRGQGAPVYAPTKKILALHGISCDEKRAAVLQKDDYGKYDLFICMDDMNIRDTIRIFGRDKNGKVKKLLDYAGGGNVADPWYSGDFETAYRDILTGCRELYKNLQFDT